MMSDDERALREKAAELDREAAFNVKTATLIRGARASVLADPAPELFAELERKGVPREHLRAAHAGVLDDRIAELEREARQFIWSRDELILAAESLTVERSSETH